MFAYVCTALMLISCGDDKTHIPADAPGYIKGKAVHPTIKIGKPYRVGWKKYYPEYDPDYDEEGMASWYGPNFHGKMTANGETFNQWAMTAAHPTLPLPSIVRVTNLASGKSAIVRINDRGPFAESRIIDLSRAAAEALGTRAKGVAKVRVQYLKPETEAYIAKLQLKKPKKWQEVDKAQAKIEKALHQPHLAATRISVSEGELSLPATLPEASKPMRPASDVPEHFAYEMAQPEATTIDARGVQMEEIGYAEDAFSVLDDEELLKPPYQAGGSGSFIRFTPQAAPAIAPSVAPLQRQTGRLLFVRAGSFTNGDNARRLADKLSAVAPAQVRPIGSLWAVELGPVFNRGIAEEVRGKLKAYGIADAMILEE